MQVKKNLPASIDNIVQRPIARTQKVSNRPHCNITADWANVPSITPLIEAWRPRDIVETRAHIGNDPEDEPHTRPRLPDDHGHILTRKSQGAHAHKVEHPVHGECAASVGVGVAVRNCCHHCLTGDWIAAREVDLECERDERVGQGEEEVCGYSGAPAPDDELVELKWWMSFGFQVFDVNWEVECEGEERQNDEVCFASS